MKKVGRNDPCLCGSGKKYKHCCFDKKNAQTAIAPSNEISIPEALQIAIEHLQCGRLPQAEAIYQKILQLAPEHADALHLLGVISLQKGNADLAITLINKAIGIKSTEPIYYNNLGIVLKKIGRLDDAATCYRQALEIQPEYAEAFYNLGGALNELGQLDDAVACFRQALLIKPDYAEAYYSLGNELKEQGKLEEAVSCYRQALLTKPGFAEVHYNLGVVFNEQGKPDEAVACYRQALLIKPDFAKAHGNLGVVLHEQGRLEEAVGCYRQAILTRPDFTQAYINLGNALKEQGKLDEAIVCHLKALILGESTDAKTGFSQCIKNIVFSHESPQLRAFLIRAISEAWSRPQDLITPAISLVAQNRGIQEGIDRATKAWPMRLSKQELLGASGLALVANDRLLQCMLENMRISSFEFERFLTLTRKILLDSALNIENSLGLEGGESNGLEDGNITFFCAIARQCFINEYIFAYADEELEQVESLRERLVANLAAKAPVHGMWVAAVAAYSSLESLPSVDALLNLTWPDPVIALLQQQVREPSSEQHYRQQIPRLTSIDDRVSCLVQEQYEENPYPRWVKTIGVARTSSVDEFLRHQYPGSSFQPLGKIDEIDILIAGCGTGRHSIETALNFLGAKVLAVDLSLSSLCYAKRKTDELGLKNIEYAQADIMKLGALNQTFDIIESVGVLHHLADPLAGWRVLLGLLRPGGFMKLGFYSELARQDVVAARTYIAEHGYAANATDIRRCRQDLMAAENKGQFKKLLSFGDFYGMSECRDLLFHVQEHRYSLLQLKNILEKFGLNFIGFSLEETILRQYLRRFPDDQAKTNLVNWHLFETENPYTFSNMYQFVVQKPG